MMVAVFAALMCAFVAGWFGRRQIAAVCIAATFLLAVGLFLYEIYSPEYGFRMPWIRTDAAPVSLSG
ncbi:MAG TPA: hypothetical protein VJV77_13945 [Casimicrobiaceae bacterium]|nr:hypothetical protein [Casimicrobiaceae bacterium]